MKKSCACIALCALLLFSGCSERGSSQTSTTTSSEPPISITDYTSSTPPDTTTSSSELVFTTTPGDTTEPTTADTYESTATETTTPPIVTTSLPGGSLLLPVLPPPLDLSGLDISALDSWYSDAVFVGDSLSLGWRNYVLTQRNQNPGFMGSAQFLVSGSLSATNSLWALDSESPHVTYAGEKMFVWNAIPQTNANKVFILFGANEGYWISLNGMDKVVENFETLLSNIKTNSPNAEIILISSTYFIASYSSTSSTLRQLNMRLIELCAEKGYGFLNIADLLADENGNLRADYCSDGKCHLTNSAYAVWANAFRGYAASRLQ